MAENNTKTRTKTKKEETKEVTPPTQETSGHILQILDENQSPLIYIGDNFKNLPLESKIAVIKHLKTFVDTQKSAIIKMVEDL